MSLLTGGEWVVEDLDGKGVIDFARTTMTFTDESKVSGNGACNQYNASIEMTGEGLSVGPVASTKKMCPPAVMNQETLFLDIFGAVTRFDIREDGALVLFDSNDRTILARR